MNSDEKQRIRRRDFLAEKVLGGAAAATFPLPALAQGIRDLTMVTDWPERLPGLYPSAVRLAQTIGAATDGRLRINVFPAGSLVRPFETLDAVEAGVADMYYSDNHYFEKKSVAFNFFASTPFGLTTDELCAWVQFGGGQELWDTLGKQFNIKSLFCGSTGCQMGGWFTKEVSAPDHFKGLRYRMAGLGAEVLRRLGATVVLVPGGEIVGALKSGAIDACEWIGPWLDMAINLQDAARYYYYPGFHEPGTCQTLGINLAVWESFKASDQRIIESVAGWEFTRLLAEFNANNARSLRKLREGGAVQILPFSEPVLNELFRLSQDVVAEAGSADSLSRKIYASYQTFQDMVSSWSDVAERAFMNARRRS